MYGGLVDLGWPCGVMSICRNRRVIRRRGSFAYLSCIWINLHRDDAWMGNVQLSIIYSLVRVFLENMEMERTFSVHFSLLKICINLHKLSTCSVLNYCSKWTIDYPLLLICIHFHQLACYRHSPIVEQIDFPFLTR